VRPADLLDVLWRDHVASAPQVARVHELLTQRGEILGHDHLAFRTYGVPGIGIDALARPFEALGWRPRDRYRFRDRQLRARYWQHADDALPKLFISELALDELSPTAQVVIERLVGQLPGGFAARGDLPWSGRPWSVEYADYLALAAESEFAAWVAAFGFRVHHFTVDVDSLSTFPDLEALGAFLIEHGFTLDDRGGRIKGSRADRIEQSSTCADLAVVAFADREVRMPSCRYHFARRYRLPSGEVFHGFVQARPDPTRAPRPATDAGIGG